MDTYKFKVHVFTKQAKYEKNPVLFSSFRYSTSRVWMCVSIYLTIVLSVYRL